MYYHAMYILGRLRRRFVNQIPENTHQYLKSRRAFTMDGATSATILALVSNTYLSGYLQHIGVSVTMIGIISALPALVAVSQPLGAAFAQKHKKRKPYVSIGAFVHRLMFALMFFVPIFISGTTARIIIVAILFSTAHFIAAFISPAASNWIISLTPQRLRGRYFSIRELYSLITLSAATLVVGFILDSFRKSGNQTSGFMMIGLIIGILTLVNLVSLSTAMEPSSIEETTQDISLYKTIKMVLTEKSFRPILVMNIIYNFGIQIVIPFYGLYVVSDLKISYTLIGIIGFVCSIEKAFIIRLWGKLADKTTWANICKLSVGVVGLTHFLYFFIVPSNAFWLYPITCIISNVGWAAIGMAFLNVQYDYAPLKGRTMYIGVCAATTGVIGFSGVFVGSFILKVMGKHPLLIFGQQIRGQQILMLLSGTMLMVCITYISNVVQKKQKIVSKKEGLAV